MISKQDLKILLRSGSYEFMKNSRPGAVSGDCEAIIWKGKPIYYRPGSSDPHLIYKILLKRGRKGEYSLPEGGAPSTILDIGGNIGIASIYFADLFPAAKIYTFEPIPENFSILLKNTGGYSNIKAFCVALGKEDCKLQINASDDNMNFGGFSFFGLGVNEGRKTAVEVKEASSFLAGLGITKVDLIKIDTEGSEFDIITALNQSMLSNVRWIIGELHGIRDFELLAYLSRWFDIEARKALRKRLFNFYASNRVPR